jgi:gliding motility-associated-like protein
LSVSVTGAQSYTWIPVSGLISTGTNTHVLLAPSATTNYTVLGANFMGPVSCYEQLSYSVIVVTPITPSVSNNVELCLGEKTTLYASGGNSFSWTPSYGLNITNGSGVVANPKITTIYTVEVSHNSYCGKTTTVMVTVNPKPDVYAGRDTSYNLNDAIFINAVGTGTLTWVSGEGIICRDCPYTQVYPTRNTCYVVQASNDYGCSVTDDICIDLTEDFTIYIPNSFTPNNDGLNDVFMIYGENISQVSMDIFDRWGVRIFGSTDYKLGWDGKYKGTLCEEGTYTYIVSYTGLNRKRYTKTGNVSIIK